MTCRKEIPNEKIDFKVIDGIPKWASMPMMFETDDSAIEESEMSCIRKFMLDNGITELIDIYSDDGFSSNPAFGLPCDTITGIFRTRFPVLKRECNCYGALQSRIFIDGESYSDDDVDLVKTKIVDKWESIVTEMEPDALKKAMCEVDWDYDDPDELKVDIVKTYLDYSDTDIHVN